MKRTWRTLLTTAMGIGLTFGLAASASAGTLKTSALFQGGASSQNVCVAINVGPAPITVTVQMIGLSSTDTETCLVLPNDINSSCQASVNDFAFCRVTSSNTGNVRAVMMNRLIVAPFTINATSEAR